MLSVLLLSEVPHLSHTKWTRSGKNSEALAKILLPKGISLSARNLFRRIVQEVNWGGAEKQASTQIPTDNAHGQYWALE